MSVVYHLSLTESAKSPRLGKLQATSIATQTSPGLAGLKARKRPAKATARHS